MRRFLATAPDDRAADHSDEGSLPDEVFERVDRLATEFTERRRRGEGPTIAEYVARHPDLAAAIRDLFPALVMVEDLKPDSDETVCRLGSMGGASDEAPPARLGEYRILREIGRGGMGVVYEAVQESLGRRVALKVLGPWVGLGGGQVRRFHREARSAAGLHHTNIVPVFGVGEHEGRHFYTMQFIHGSGLHQVIDELRRLEGLERVGRAGPALGPDDATAVGGLTRSMLLGVPAPIVSARDEAAATGPAERMASTAVDSRHQFLRSVARIGLQVAEALAHAHGQGVLHRDIKPSNILLDGHGHAWVTDFGLAKAADDEDLTITGDLVGTIRYMAPERFRGDCDPRSDVYALGLTLYELLARRPAFPDSDRHALLHNVAQVDPPRVETLAAGVPRDLATIVHKAIEKSPADRYPSAAALAGDLRRFLENRPIEARRVGPAERLLRWSRRNPGVAGLATAVAALLLAIAVISTAAAFQLRERRNEVERRLWEANVARARASRRSGTEGRRFEALDALADAARLGVHADRRDELRDEAIACLALADLRRIGQRTLPSLADRGHLLAFSPDGRRLAVGDEHGRVRVLDAEGGTGVSELGGPGSYVNLLRFSEDGRRLAIRHGRRSEGPLRVYDVDTGATLLDEPVRVASGAVDFDRSGNRLAVGLDDGTIRVHDLDGRGDPVSIRLAPDPSDIRFDPTGRRLAVAWYDAEDSVVVIDLDGPEVVARWTLADGALCVAWSPDGRQLAAGGGNKDPEVFLLDPDDPSGTVRSLPGHKGAVISLDYAHRGHLIASSSWDGTVRLWHPESGEPLVVASSPDHWSIRFSPDDRVLSGGRDGSTCWRWEVADGDELRGRFLDQYPDTRTPTIDRVPGGPMYTSSGDAGVRLLDEELRRVALLPVTGGGPAEILPDRRTVLTGGASGLLRWTIRPGEAGLQVGPPEPFGPMPGRPAGRICVDAAGRRVAVLLDSPPTMVAVFDANGDRPPAVIRGHPGLERIDLSPDGRLLATGTWKGQGVKVWDASTGGQVADLNVEGSAEVAFGPDGRSLLTGSGREYTCWEVGTWSPRWSLPRREASNMPGKIAHSADGSLVAVAWTRTLVRLLDARTGAVIATFEAPTTDHVAELGLSRDGAFLFVMDHGGGIRRWDLRAIRRQLDAMSIGWPELPSAGQRRGPSSPPVPIPAPAGS